MTRPTLLRVGWTRVKQRAPAVITAALIYGGFHQIFEVLKYSLSGQALGLINTAIRNNFHDHLPLPNSYTGIPWQYHAKVAALGVLVLAVGMLLGLLVNARNQRQPAP